MCGDHTEWQQGIIIDSFSQLWMTTPGPHGYICSNTSQIVSLQSKALLRWQKLSKYGKKVKKMRSGNALEFDDKQCRPFFDELGIIHQTSCVDRPEQNGIVERKHRNILEILRILLRPLVLKKNRDMMSLRLSSHRDLELSMGEYLRFPFKL